MVDIASLFYGNESETSQCCVADGVRDLPAANRVCSNISVKASMVEGVGKCLEVVFCKDKAYHFVGSRCSDNLVCSCWHPNSAVYFTK